MKQNKSESECCYSKVIPEKTTPSGWKINVPQLTKGMPVTTDFFL